MPNTSRMTCLAVLDAARDYMRIGMARLVSPQYDCLYAGEKGDQLEHVAPHLFECDPNGVIAHLAVAGEGEGEAGLLIESDVEFRQVRKHLRRFLTVVRQRDRRHVLFRYYDPRVLRAFLPACNREELLAFFGPLAAFHCQGDQAGEVLSFELDEGSLLVRELSVEHFMKWLVRTYPPAAASVAGRS